MASSGEYKGQREEESTCYGNPTMITVIDYGAGNVGSIRNMLRKIGCECRVSEEPRDLEPAERIILPGVGHFGHGMEQLRARGFLPVLNERVIEARVPILGICLGAQLLATHSEEGDVPGLGWIDADVVRFDSAGLGPGAKIPHMGWADVESSTASRLLSGMPELPARFYFVHSYHIVCRRSEDVLMTAEHGRLFVAAVRRENILGVQFHPEKSHAFGLQFLRNFVGGDAS